MSVEPSDGVPPDGVGEHDDPSLPRLPAAERLVNLTPHDIVVHASTIPREGDDLDHAEPTALRLAPLGGYARVDDYDATRGRSWLNTGTGLVPVTRLRRSGKLVGLPPAQRGTRLVVSRITAQAARHRSDLVFPFGEIRDDAGQIVAASGLAAFGQRPTASAMLRILHGAPRLARANLLRHARAKHAAPGAAIGSRSSRRVTFAW